ncbi:hypothetical protein CFC21_065670 [Triticum aestivum]|uniref:Uncharacterized protein n=2 Tax=Triticum aestivum TaxID=4565 RepID=A0A3B6KF93_WHEAT|nr:hypothetical protein CFC21_065670 [Triticum aestivum]
MSMDSFRKSGAVLMNTSSSLFSSTPPFSCAASSPAGSAPFLVRPFAGADRHRIRSRAFGGGTDGALEQSSPASLLGRPSSWSGLSSLSSCSWGSWLRSSTMSHLENTLAAALPPTAVDSRPRSPTSSSSSVEESTAAGSDDPKHLTLCRRLQSAPPRKGSASLLIPTVSSQLAFFLRSCSRSISSATVTHLLPLPPSPLGPCFSTTGLGFFGRPTLICPAHVTLGDCGSSSPTLCFALEPRNSGLLVLPRPPPPYRAAGAAGNCSCLRRAATALSRAALDGLHMDLGISARCCRPGKQTSRSVGAVAAAPPRAALIFFIASPVPLRQAAVAAGGFREREG